MTDKQRILAHFRNSNGRLISCSELVDGQFYGTKRIIEYTGRIADARKELGCTCGKDQTSCEAQEHIINTKTNWYQYRSDSKKEVIEQPINEKLISLQVENRLNKLRMMYRQARSENNQKEMDRIALMANTCKLALHTNKKRIVEIPKETELVQYAREALL